MEGKEIRKDRQINFTYLVDMLEPVDDEALEGPGVEYLVVVNVELVERVDALDFAEQDERIQEVVGKHQLLQFREFTQFVEVGVVNY